VESRDEPAVLLLRLELGIGELLEVRLHLGDREERGPVAVIDDRRDVVVEQHPLAVAVRAAGEPDLERVVALDAHAAAAAVTQEVLHLGGPLRVGGAAQAVSVGEEAGPVLAGPEVVALGPALAPEILVSLGAVPVVGVAPEPRGERFVLVGLDVAAGDALVDLGLRGEQPLERGARQLAGVPRMVGLDLGIAGVGRRRARRQEKSARQDQSTRHGSLPVEYYASAPGYGFAAASDL
jgi:hypothetical protein